MNHLSPIEHEGIIQEVKDGHLKVALVVNSACSACHARQACNLSDQEVKIVEAVDLGGSFKVGETVKVILAQKNATLAVFYGYILPFFAVFLTLVISIKISQNELKAGILAIGILIPYYLVLFLFHRSFKKALTFQIQKI